VASDVTISNDKSSIQFDPGCIRKKNNWSQVENHHKMDNPKFEPQIFLKDMPYFSPKLDALLKKIKALDSRDQQKHGTTFKHFIFSDIKSGGQGAKMIASGLIASGFNLGYRSELKKRKPVYSTEDEQTSSLSSVSSGGGDNWSPIVLLSHDQLKHTPGENFFLLSSVAVYDKPISIQMKKQILQTFNSRPDNIYGDLARIIVMDSGFKEGIDLFDIKYIHIFEPSMNMADQKQVIGRGTRTCGQKGLEFHPTKGWPLEIFIYDMEIPDSLRFSLLGAETAHELVMRAMNADIRIANFSYDVERLAVLGSVDYELNENVHNFKVDLSDEDEDEEIVFGGAGDEIPGSQTIGHKTMTEYIRTNFGQYKWDKVKMENLCGELPESWKKRSSRKSRSSLKEDKEHSNRRSSSKKSEEEEVDEEVDEEEIKEPSVSRMSASSRRSSSKKSEEEEEEEEEEGIKEPSVSRLTASSALEEEEDEEEIKEPKEIFPVLNLRQRPISEVSTVSEVPLSSVVTKKISPSERASQERVTKRRTRKSQKQMKGGESSTVSFNPTQAFIQHYFTPFCPVKGMLLYHSTGSGKTCSAIAAATSNFEPMDFTILWVTRTTLKNDIWKNMFDQVCHKQIQERIEKGEKIPDSHQERMSLLSKAWRIRPMSYKQFSNLVSKKNAFYQTLVKENGVEDPLRKTLLIIDEAHKLYGGGDLSSLERPDMKAFHSALMNSYMISGIDSVRVLLMTATPITENPMELVQLINLCRPIEVQLPDTLDSFSQNYLKEDGSFTQQGQAQFLDDIAGHISYLNREKDARQFSLPRIKKVMVPMITNLSAVEDFDKYVFRTETEKKMMEIQTNLEETVNKLEHDLVGLTKQTFQPHFQELCSNYRDLPPKLCSQVINKNITDLMGEIKQQVKIAKERIKAIRTELAAVKKGRQARLIAIQRNIMKAPKLFKLYQDSTYFAIRSKCSSKITENSKLIEAIQQMPEVIEIETEIQAANDNIKQLKEQLKQDLTGFKLKIKQMKRDLKENRMIAPSQRLPAELEIRDKEAELQKIQKLSTKEIKEQIKEEHQHIKRAEKERKDVFVRVRKTLKKRASLKVKEERDAKNAIKKLKKTEKKMDDIELAQDVKDMIERRRIIINRDLTDAHTAFREKERAKREKEREKEEREHDKQVRKTIKEREKAEEKERKELEKHRQAQQKQAEKAEKKTAAKTKKSHK
jgi:hypothetical protein